MTLRISTDKARRLVLSLQGLSDPPRRRLSADTLLDLIERLGYVQLDSINWVARAHHMILFARNQTYQPELLRQLLEQEARLFENWTHDAAIIPTRFYPYWNRRFEREQERLKKRYGNWHGEHYEQQIGGVLTHIRQNGPVMAREFSKAKNSQPRGWWDWHPSKTALEFLWRTGQLAISQRQGFQKVYDLAERVIPQDAYHAQPSHEDFVHWACQAALDRLGFATPGEIARFWGLVTTTEAKHWCSQQLGQTTVQALVEPMNGANPRKVFARADIDSLLDKLPSLPKRLRVLNPFDPILRDRKRLQQLFGFDYRIEIFVPAAKRQYGYYVFPLLENDCLVGRIDMKTNRERQSLDITALWMEPGWRFTKGRQQRLEAELERMRRFVNVEKVYFMNGFLKQDG